MSKPGSRPKTAHEQAVAEVLKKKYADEMGQKVLVERWKVDDERAAELREVLRDVGRDIQAIKLVDEGCEWKGSMSMHIYWSETLRRMMFVPITALDHVPLTVAEDACREQWGSICENFGVPRQKRRSGAS